MFKFWLFFISEDLSPENRIGSVFDKMSLIFHRGEMFLNLGQTCVHYFHENFLWFRFYGLTEKIVAFLVSFKLSSELISQKHQPYQIWLEHFHTGNHIGNDWQFPRKCLLTYKVSKLLKLCSHRLITIQLSFLDLKNYRIKLTMSKTTVLTRKFCDAL